MNHYETLVVRPLEKHSLCDNRHSGVVEDNRGISRL